MTSIESAWELLPPDSNASVVTAEGVLSAEILRQRQTRFVEAVLQTPEVTEGARIAVLADNGLVHLYAMAAIASGLVAAPLNTRLPREAQLLLLDSMAPALVLAQRKYMHLLEGWAGQIVWEDELHAWTDAALAAASQQQTPTPIPKPGPGRIAQLLLTGGSTGTPKAACLSHEHLQANCKNTVAAWNLRASDCVIQATPMFHAAVHVLATPLFAVGGTVVLQPRFDPGEYLQLIARHRVTILFLVPTMYRMLAEHPDFASADLSSVRFAISGGAPCPPDLRDAFANRGIAFRQGYGMTEAGVNCFTMDAELASQRPDAVGYPMPDMQAVIRDEHGIEVPAGVVGELTLRGPSVFVGYWDQPDDTQAALRKGWLWTGDLAVRDADGVYSIVGRRKDMFISGGENVFPPEVEAAMLALPQVQDCAVIGVPDARWGEVGLAAVVWADADTALSVDALQAALAGRLARYKMPKHLEAITELPRTGAGKIDKPALRRRYTGSVTTEITGCTEETDASHNQPRGNTRAA